MAIWSQQSKSPAPIILIATPSPISSVPTAVPTPTPDPYADCTVPDRPEQPADLGWKFDGAANVEFPGGDRFPVLRSLTPGTYTVPPGNYIVALVRIAALPPLDEVEILGIYEDDTNRTVRQGIVGRINLRGQIVAVLVRGCSPETTLQGVERLKDDPNVKEAVLAAYGAR
jgi:hypothetical protein